MLDAAEDANVDDWLLLYQLCKVFLLNCNLTVLVDRVTELLSSELLVDQLDLLEQDREANKRKSVHVLHEKPDLGH